MAHTDYFYYGDATGSATGLSEADAYDGTSSSTMPDGTTQTSTWGNIVKTLEVGDRLFIKKGSSALSTPASVVKQGMLTNAADHNNVNTHGFVSVIGYQGNTSDNLRAEIDLGGRTWRYLDFARIHNLSFINATYGGDAIMLGESCIFSNCRLEKNSVGSCIRTQTGTVADRCELINNYSTTTSTDCCVNVNTNSQNVNITNCYMQGSNGASGIVNPASGLGSTNVFNCIINLNLDIDGAGNSDGDGIYFVDASYERFGLVAHGNIIHNARNAFMLGVNDTRFGGSMMSNNIISSCQKVIEGTSTYPDFYFWPQNSLDVTTHASELKSIKMYNNFFYANTSNGRYLGSHNDTQLTSDPFVDVANKDFTIATPSDFGYAQEFLQDGASGDTITENALMYFKLQAATSAPTVVNVF